MSQTSTEKIKPVSIPVDPAARELLKRMIVTTSDKKGHQCGLSECICGGKSFSRKGDALRHMEEKQGLGGWRCPAPGCSHKSTQETHMKLHINTKHVQDQDEIVWHYCRFSCGEKWKDPSPRSKHEKTCSLNTDGNKPPKESKKRSAPSTQERATKRQKTGGYDAHFDQSRNDDAQPIDPVLMEQRQNPGGYDAHSDQSRNDDAQPIDPVLVQQILQLQNWIENNSGFDAPAEDTRGNNDAQPYYVSDEGILGDDEINMADQAINQPMGGYLAPQVPSTVQAELTDFASEFSDWQVPLQVQAGSIPNSGSMSSEQENFPWDWSNPSSQLKFGDPMMGFDPLAQNQELFELSGAPNSQETFEPHEWVSAPGASDPAAEVPSYDNSPLWEYDELFDEFFPQTVN